MFWKWRQRARWELCPLPPHTPSPKLLRSPDLPQWTRRSVTAAPGVSLQLGEGRGGLVDTRRAMVSTQVPSAFL